MKLRIEISDEAEDEVIIRCRSMTREVCMLRDAVGSIAGAAAELSAYIGGREYFVPIDQILFFETNEGRVSVHTAEKMYTTEAKLYELEQTLPRVFVRVSKSCIVHSGKISAIDKNLSGASRAYFSGSHKLVYVSRLYYKELIRMIDETRLFK